MTKAVQIHVTLSFVVGQVVGFLETELRKTTAVKVSGQAGARLQKRAAERGGEDAHVELA